MAKYGYARVSTTDQNTSIQRAALESAGCDVIRAERISATSTQGRVELRTILDFIRQGDSLVVTRVDRLARSMGDLQDIVRELKSKGANLIVTEQSVDTSTAAGKAFFDMLGVFAEFETNLRSERQKEGIAKAKAEGAYRNPKKRSRTIDRKKVADVLRHSSKADTARILGISRSQLFAILKQEGAASAPA